MAYGFKPVKHAGGGIIRPNVFMDYTIADAYNTDLFAGDVVSAVTGGTIGRTATGTDDNTIVGIFAGVEYTPDTGANAGVPVFDTYWPASTSISGTVKAYVYDDPKIIFKVQADQVGTAIVQTDVFGMADHVVGTGDSDTKRSGSYIDSSAGFAETGHWMLLEPADGEKSWTAAGTAQDVLVLLAEGFWGNASANFLGIT